LASIFTPAASEPPSFRSGATHLESKRHLEESMFDLVYPYPKKIGVVRSAELKMILTMKLTATRGFYARLRHSLVTSSRWL